MFLANKLNKGAGAPTPKDAQFNYVTMLLHGDGTNGAQNNTFLDSSTNAFTITRNGNTTQGSFSPYGSNWSNYFDGNGDYLSVPSNTALNCGMGDFTIECWVYVSSRILNYPLIIGNNNGSYSAGAISLTNNNADSAPYTDKFVLVVYDFLSLVPTLVASSTNSLNTWYHLAIVRNGNSLVMYRDGTSVASNTITSGIVFDWGKSNCLIGGGNWDGAQSYFNGQISNLRLVKGTAVYTSSFTPSTTPLTAISGTSLLTCQSNRFIDNSTNNFAITKYGDTSVQRFNPFGASTAYSTNVIGGSGYFDGSGDLLTLADSPAWAYGSGDFTIEFWYYPVSNTTTDIEFIGQWTSGSTDESWSVGHHWTFGLVFFWTTDGSTDQSIGSTSTALLTLNAWNHVAVSKSGTTVSLYLNGARTNTGTLTGSISDSSRVLDIGGRTQSGANQIQGYLSDVRTVKGTAVYDPTSTTLTVPTAPLTAITNTALLMNFTNGAIFDNAMMNDLETVGNAQISTSVKKYGTGSLAFDGTGDSLLSTGTQNAAFGTGDFTVEMWLYLNTTGPAYQGVVDTRPNGGASANAFLIYIAGGGTLYYFSNSTNILSYSPISTGAWIHVAVTRSNGSLRLFINGTISGSAVSNTTNLTETRIIIGSSYDNFDFNGYIDDLRLTKGYARYTANFTAPTAAFLDIGPN